MSYVCPQDGYLCLIAHMWSYNWRSLKLDTQWEKVMVDEVRVHLRQGQVLPEYELGRRLGAGEFGEVYQVRNHPELVVKRIKSTLRSTDARPGQSLEDFLPVVAMVELGQSLQKALPGHGHAHVHTAVHDLYVSEDHIHIVSPRCEMDLKEKINIIRWKRGREKLGVVFRVVQGILRGIALMHKEGFVHLDIKPANVLICQDVAKLADFDFTTRWTPEDKKLKRIGGTRRYMCRQSRSGSFFDGRKRDMYAVGHTIQDVLLSFDRDERVGDWEFLDRLSDEMISYAEADRPSAAEALQKVELYMDNKGLASVY